MELEKEYLLRKKQGPTYVGGDFNARLHQALGIGENNVMGTHFFDKGNEQTHLMTDPIWCNRSHFVNFSIQNNLKIINTLFEKPNDKLATYQNPKAKLGMSKRRGTHETLDYWLTENRWQNSCVDCEADGGANINTDHYPLILEIKLQLKKLWKPKTEQRIKFDEATEEQKQKYNDHFHENDGILRKHGAN